MRYKSKMKYKKWVLVSAIIISTSSLGTSYASWIDSGLIIKTLVTATMNFIFQSEYEDDFRLYLDYNSENISDHYASTIQLDVTIVDTGKTLNIKGMDSFIMNDLLSGIAKLKIDYRLVTDNKNVGIDQIRIGKYDLNNVPFVLSEEDPYWSINIEGASWGPGVPGIGMPVSIIELLPEKIDFKGVNHILYSEKGVVKGTITLEVNDLSMLTEESVLKLPELNLKDLGLSDTIYKEIVAKGTDTCSLQIVAKYDFNVPFLLE